MAHTTAKLEVAAGEILPLSVNVDAALEVGDTVSSVLVVVRELTSLAQIASAVTGTPTVTGVTLAVTLNATALKATNSYELVALMTVSPNVKVVAVIVPIDCVA